MYNIIITGCIYVGTISSVPAVDIPQYVSSATSHYRAYLKTVYKKSPIAADNKWPPTPSKAYISLALVEGEGCRENYIGHTLKGNIKEVLNNRKEISMEQILEADDNQQQPRLVLMEGAPGIGKSTLAWELCRKWEEFSCMKQYSLVVLLRLREEEVQNINDVSDLFYSYESADKKSLVEEVFKSQGKGILFLLDGFDELPNHLQRNGYLLKLIRGSILPESTVLVTSRPSATAELLTSCKPQKRVEVLGFTQESVEAYASSVFQSEPDTLEKFKAYISASNNTAITGLMYIPLNAAIVVQIYKSESLLPHTLTELYTQLCLTVLNRFLKMEHRVVKFEYLPSDLYHQFLKLSNIAYEGVKRNELIFHEVPVNLVHFGFLDAVSSLYGGGGVSYNFLHLTLQEFFAAYYISSLGSGGLEVFKQYGNNEQWNVVWRFVAGLTKFQHLEGHINSTVTQKIPLFIMQCLFEAQTLKYFVSYFESLPSPKKLFVDTTLPLDSYACGYCIANILTGMSFSMHFMLLSQTLLHNFQHFICGLKTNVPSAGYIEELDVGRQTISPCPDLEYCSPQRLTSISLHYCELTATDMIHLSELIPSMTCLKELNISINDGISEDSFVKVLQSLSHSSVTTLHVQQTGFCIFKSESFLAALKQLLDPSCGKLEKLFAGDYYCTESQVMNYLSAQSSLKSLTLSGNTPSLFSSLRSNTCLTELHVKFLSTTLFDRWDLVYTMNELVTSSTALKHLIIEMLKFPEDYFALKLIVESLRHNKTLLKLTVGLEYMYGGTAFENVRKFDTELTLDPRIVYKYAGS